MISKKLWPWNYIWIGGKGELRSKTRVLHGITGGDIYLTDIPMWDYDGSSTGQDQTQKSY